MEGFLGIIPARGGSKRLPGKNIRPLGGIPLIAWTIRAGLGCARLAEVMVSTDSEEIADAAEAAGAKVPFLRPSYLSSDTATSLDVILHTVDFYRREAGRNFRYAVLLQPTSPFRTASDIDVALDLLEEKRADEVLSVCETDHNPLWSNTLPPDHSLRGFLREEVKNRRSQDLPIHYRLNGALYVCSIERMEREKTLFLPDNVFAYVMPKERSVDIDDDLDFAFAELLATRRGALP